MLYPQNGDRIVTIDSVTSLHPVYFVRLHLVSPPRSIAISMYVCLSVRERISGIIRPVFTDVLCILPSLPMAVASYSGGVAIRYVFPLLFMRDVTFARKGSQG